MHVASTHAWFTYLYSDLFSDLCKGPHTHSGTPAQSSPDSENLRLSSTLPLLTSAVDANEDVDAEETLTYQLSQRRS
jgi:hypothetical protein